MSQSKFVFMTVMITAIVFAAMAPAQAGFYQYQATPNLAIPDDTCGSSSVTSQINVPVDHTITELELGIVLTHSYRGDLWIQLTSPASETITLFLDHTLGGTPGDGANNIYGTFDEDAAGFPDNGLNDSNASYANRRFQTWDDGNPSALGLDNYIGDSSLGTWTMTICDDASVDTGTLGSWALQITDDIPTTTTTTTTTPATTTTTIPSDDDTDDDMDDDADDDVDDDSDDDADDDDTDDDSDDDTWFPDDDDGGWFPDDDEGDDDDDDAGPNWPGGGGESNGGSSGDDDDDGGGMCA
ncbi:MAG: proprotein convertase P-domain-containing protein [Deltaproteobacteria bacterium]|nr:proprotein convertase P-domain-containing protein [Deltaproteobacteria bacterium]